MVEFLILVLLVVVLISYFKLRKHLFKHTAELRDSIDNLYIKIKVLAEKDNLQFLSNNKLTPLNTPALPPEAEKVAHSPASTSSTAQEIVPDQVLNANKNFDIPDQTLFSKPPIPNEASVGIPQAARNSDTPETVKNMAVEHQETFPLIENVHTVWEKMWNWFVVGEEHRKKGISMEYAVASTWLLRLGIITLIGCVAYFLQWSIAKGILGPEGRVAISTLAGLSLLWLGMHNNGKKYHLLAQGFLGGGLAFLYFSTYAAGPLYNLVPIPIAFVLMGLVTVSAGVLSLATRSQLVAILGIIGGYATPLMLQPSDPNLVTLYAYLLLLGLGILALSHVRQWRILNYLSFVFTWGLFITSLAGYHADTDFTASIIFLSLIFILHSAIAYFYNIATKKQTTLLEIIHLFLNGAVFAATSYFLILDARGKPWPAVMAIALALFYIGHIYVFLKNRLNDRNIIISLISMAGFFTIWTIPLITEKETLTICWAILSCTLLWTGFKLSSNFLVTIANILYIIVLSRVTFLDLPGSASNLNWRSIPFHQYIQDMIPRLLTITTVILSLLGAYKIYTKKLSSFKSMVVNSSNDTEPLIDNSITSQIAYWATLILGFIFVYFELTKTFSYFLPLQAPVLTIMWLLSSVYFLKRYLTSDKLHFLVLASFMLIIMLLKLLINDFSMWNYNGYEFVYSDAPLLVLMRLLDYGFIVALLAYFLSKVGNVQKPINFQIILRAVIPSLIFVYITLETNTFFHWKVPSFQSSSLSIVWSLFAIAMLILGIWKTNRGWRYSGLTLFSVVVCKVFLFDLAAMEMIYRVIAFMIVGMLLIAGSFVYIKSSNKFTIKGSGE